jgi:hypothetical protein
MLGKRLLMIVLTMNVFVLPAQQHDTTTFHEQEFITDQIENIASLTEKNFDYSDLVDDYSYYRKHPVSINDKDQVDELERLRLLNKIQINNIKRYREHYGNILSQYELMYVDGFNRSVVMRILPFVRFTVGKSSDKLSLTKAFRYGHNELILRYKQNIEKSAGYLIIKDSAISHPSSVYLGTPFTLYTRYAFKYGNRVRIGLTMEKDEGEIFLKSSLSDTLLNMIGKKVTNIYDFYSAHFYIAEVGFLKKAVVGDYHVEFGQGLNLWTGLSFGKSAEAIYVKKYGRGIRPNTSTNENIFFRGAAATFKIDNVEVTGFYSNNNIDANIAPAEYYDQPVVVTIQETGLHRTVKEIQAKNAINIQAYGGHIDYRYKYFKVGVTAFHTKLNKPVVSSGYLYKKFSYSGDEESHYGADFAVVLSKINFFGEFSLTQKKAYAVIAGLNAEFSDRFLFTLIYRNYGKDFHNFYGNPFGASQYGGNEEGIYFGFLALLSKSFSLSGYADYYYFPWLRFYSDFPSYGKDFLFQLNFTPSRRVVMYLKYRHKEKQENFNNYYNYLSRINNINQNNIRFNVVWNLTKRIIMKNRVEYIVFTPDYEVKSNGYVMYQDVLYRPDIFPVSITLRYALFSTGSWDTRIYTYENDVLYSFSVPAYYGNGQRFYLMAKCSVDRHLTFWIRFARTTWFDRNQVSSGANLINGNHKTEINVQMKLKL